MRAQRFGEVVFQLERGAPVHLRHEMRADPGLFLEFAQCAVERLLALVDPALRHLPDIAAFLGGVDAPADVDLVL